jgi:hypothetical protein
MKSKNITLGGIMIALSIIVLYLTTIIPINTIAILTLASSLIPITILKSDIKTAFIVYISTSILGFFFIPINFVLFYTFFFGIYGILKYYIEKLKNLTFEIILKLIFFNSIFILITLLIGFPLGNIDTKFPLLLIIIGTQIGFIIYDYSLSLIITFYLQKIHKK